MKPQQHSSRRHRAFKDSAEFHAALRACSLQVGVDELTRAASSVFSTSRFFGDHGPAGAHQFATSFFATVYQTILTTWHGDSTEIQRMLQSLPLFLFERSNPPTLSLQTLLLETSVQTIRLHYKSKRPTFVHGEIDIVSCVLIQFVERIMCTRDDSRRAFLTDELTSLAVVHRKMPPADVSLTQQLLTIYRECLALIEEFERPDNLRSVESFQELQTDIGVARAQVLASLLLVLRSDFCRLFLGRLYFSALADSLSTSSSLTFIPVLVYLQPFDATPNGAPYPFVPLAESVTALPFPVSVSMNEDQVLLCMQTLRTSLGHDSWSPAPFVLPLSVSRRDVTDDNGNQPASPPFMFHLGVSWPLDSSKSVGQWVALSYSSVSAGMQPLLSGRSGIHPGSIAQPGLAGSSAPVPSSEGQAYPHPVSFILDPFGQHSPNPLAHVVYNVRGVNCLLRDPLPPDFTVDVYGGGRVTVQDLITRVGVFMGPDDVDSFVSYAALAEHMTRSGVAPHRTALPRTGVHDTEDYADNVQRVMLPCFTPRAATARPAGADADVWSASTCRSWASNLPGCCYVSLETIQIILTNLTCPSCPVCDLPFTNLQHYYRWGQPSVQVDVSFTPTNIHARIHLLTGLGVQSFSNDPNPDQPVELQSTGYEESSMHCRFPKDIAGVRVSPWPVS